MFITYTVLWPPEKRGTYPVESEFIEQEATPADGGPFAIEPGRFATLCTAGEIHTCPSRPIG